METTISSYRKGLLLMTGASLCWSTGGILVRMVRIADPWEIVFWRSVFMVLFLLAILFFQHRTNVGAMIIEVGLQGVLAGAFFAATFFFFILSLAHNTVANTYVLMSIGPFFVAVFGRILLGERVPLRTWNAIVVALAGIILMFFEGLDAGRSLGNLFALAVPTAFALNLVILRHAHASVDMVPTVMLSGIFSMAIALPLAWPLSPTLHDLTVLWIMGWVQLGLGGVLMTMATRCIPASEIGLLRLLETMLAPMWVWLGIGERPTNVALIGGFIIVGALLANGLLGMRGIRDPRRNGSRPILPEADP